MGRKAVVGLAMLGLWGCSKQTTSYSRSAGTLATSQDGALIYAVDSDNDAVEIARAEDGTKVGEVKVGKDPARIAVGSDGRIYVSNRGERTVSVIDKDAKKEIAKVPVGVEPHGLALSGDGKTLYVVSATDADDPQHGTLTAVDTDSLKPTWRTQVGEEPRGVAVVGNKAYVTNLKQGRVLVVDTEKRQVASGIDLNNNDNPDPTINAQARTAGAVTDVAPAPDGERVYTSQVWQLAGAINAQKAAPGQGGSYGAPESSPTCNTGSVVAAGVGTIVTSTNTTKTDSFNCTPESGQDTSAKDFPPSATATAADNKPLVGPSTALVDPSGSWLFVANRHSNNVTVMPTHRRLDQGKPLVVDLEGTGKGAGPDGLALSKDGKTLYVYSQLDHTLHVVRSDAGTPTSLRVVESHKLADDVLPNDVVVGRKMFFSALDTRMTAGGTNMACAGCHLEGREDGHVWLFPDGPRQTPSLAGRHLEATAPYHWAGLFANINGFFTETIRGRMGGSGLSDAEADVLFTYLKSIPPAENALQGRPDLQAAIERGQAAFVKANCASCHTQGVLTDNQEHNVGTLGPSDKLELLTDDGVENTALADQFPQLQAVNTPSLLGLGRTAPYLHDGSVLTLRGRLNQARTVKGDGTDHGDTSKLSDQEIADLETYLLSL